MKREDLKVFKNSEFGKVRVTINNGIPMFSAIDVAKSLGYSDSDQAIRAHCKKSESIFVLHGDGKPGGTSMKFIPESDVFRLIMSSKLPEAEKFQDWVFEEVLPSIRKTGGYIETNDNDSDEDILAKAILIAQKTIENKDKRIKELEDKVSKDAPIVEYTNEFLRIEDSDKLTTQISKEYGLSATKMNEILCGLEIQYWKGGQYHLYAKYDGQGYANNRKYSIWNPITKSKDVVQCLVWTEKGRKFIYDKFKEGKFNKFLNEREMIEMFRAVESLKNSSIYEKESV
jgi:prophage antirepressor-like protein